MNDILMRQLAADYCCQPADVLDSRNHFTVHRKLPGRRCFQESAVCYLKMAVIGGKLLFTGDERIIRWCSTQYASSGAEWFLEAKNLRPLNDRLLEDGYMIDILHPFYIAENITIAENIAIAENIPEVNPSGMEIRWYEDGEIEQFQGDDRFTDAFAFCSAAPDRIGVAAVRDGQILGMAGASADSPYMWQIGINVIPECRGKGIGEMLVGLLKNEVLRRGILPFYGTAFSHIASQRLALGAGFVPAWVEMTTCAKE